MRKIHKAILLFAFCFLWLVILFLGIAIAIEIFKTSVLMSIVTVILTGFILIQQTFLFFSKFNKG